MGSEIREIHPGEILSEEFLKPLGLNSEILAAAIGAPAAQIFEFIDGKHYLSADIAKSLGHYFDIEEQFWLNLQHEYDVRVRIAGCRSTA